MSSVGMTALPQQQLKIEDGGRKARRYIGNGKGNDKVAGLKAAAT
jgi:hypothetical protein